MNVTENPRNRDRGIVLVSALAYLALFLAFLCCPAIPVQAEPSTIDSETCLACHEGYDAALAGTGHTLSASARTGVDCISCHEGGETHVDDPSRDNIGNPAELHPLKTEQLCTACHLAHSGLGLIGHDPHAGVDMSCTSCHSVHASAADASTLGTLMCGNCHTAVAHQFQQRSNHPLTTGNLSCVSCHAFLGETEPQLGHGPAANCYSCHPDQSGPYLFEHEATSSFSPEGEGCIACHAPHGSVNDRLLVQQDDNLCRQCHGIPAGHISAHDGDFRGVTCVDCHTDFHGSYDNLYLLDPQLGTRFGRESDACFCHFYR